MEPGGLVNPYDLLGVTPNHRPSDVRKAYYALACLCHPDRGGTAEQMQIVHNAYRYVYEQVCLNRTDTTLGDLEKEFADFCAHQEQRPPAFVEIHAEAFSLPRFNELFQQTTRTEEMDGAFAEGGYEIAPSEATLEYSPAEDPGAPLPAFTTEIVVYTEPQAVVMPATMVRDFTRKKLTDFSCPVGALHACDYKAALSPPMPLDASDQRIRQDVREAFEEARSRRGATSAHQGATSAPPHS